MNKTSQCSHLIDTPNLLYILFHSLLFINHPIIDIHYNFCSLIAIFFSVIKDFVCLFRRWDVDDEILPTRPIDAPVRKPPPKMSSKLSSIFDDECDYQPSDNSPKGVESKKDDEYSDEDDLDKYMASIEVTCLK